MPKKPAKAADADLILQLYDLRRESEMRKARNYMMSEFWPRTFEDFQQVGMAFGTQHNAYYRQFSSYWEMAASLVVSGALHEGLFAMNSGEMLMFYAKIKPFLKQIRATMGNPDYFANLEKVLEGSAAGRERVRRTEQALVRFAAMREQQAQKQSAS